jgi:hypothetical protein
MLSFKKLFTPEEINILLKRILSLRYGLRGGNLAILYCWLVALFYGNISAISWRSVILVEETTDMPQVTDKLYHIMLYTSP